MITNKFETKEQIIEFIELAEKFFKETSFSSFTFNPVALDKFLMLASVRDNHYVSMYYSKDKLVGISGAYLHTMPFIDERVATELFLYVEESYRHTDIATTLLHDMEKWAKSQGATALLFGSNTGINPEATDRFCVKNEYTPYGKNYIKDFRCVD